MCIDTEKTETFGLDERKLFDDEEIESLADELREK